MKLNFMGMLNRVSVILLLVVVVVLFGVTWFLFGAPIN